ncbi:MAG: biopolymer transporter ExbD [Burkholderiaceae bacterium]|nr:biopolymer transporter ExbD [Roseateles sp.]MBV8468977.1 biopolymer transporter ExbD [Burkholderiaceae bacterium]
MAFGRLERRESPKPMADINMTPLIDVMLVLMVIFMITAPLMSSALHLDLPKSETATAGAASDAIGISLAADGVLRLNQQILSAAELKSRLQDLGRTHPERELQLRADQSVPYGQVAALIDWAQSAGLNRIAFVADSPARQP